MTIHKEIQLPREARLPRPGAATARPPLVVDTIAHGGGPAVVVAVGEVDLVTVGQLEHGLAAAADTIVDLSRVEFLAVAGVRVLLHAARRAHAADHTFAVVAASRPASRVLRLIGADPELTVFPTIAAASRQQVSSARTAGMIPNASSTKEEA